MITTFMRGHEIHSHNGRNWFYADDGSVADDSRPCKRCGRMPTPEGYDACLGHIEGATSACCGHGVEEPILMMEDYETVDELELFDAMLERERKEREIEKARLMEEVAKMFGIHHVLNFLERVFGGNGGAK